MILRREIVSCMLMSVAIPQSFCARGSSKPLPYDVAMDFQNKTIIFLINLFFALCFSCTFFAKIKEPAILKQQVLCYAFLKESGRGTGQSPGRGVRGGTPEKNYFANSRLFSKPFCTAFMQAERKPFSSKAATPATVVPPGEQTLSFNCSG